MKDKGISIKPINEWASFPQFESLENFIDKGFFLANLHAGVSYPEYIKPVATFTAVYYSLKCLAEKFINHH